MLQYQNIPSVSITTDLIIEVIRYWETDKLMVANSSFPIFYFLKKILKFLIGNSCSQLFPLKLQAWFLSFRENVSLIP